MRILFLSLLFLGCAATPDTPASTWEAGLLQDLDGWPEWTVMGDYLSWAPTDCRLPPPAGVERSRSRDAATHGQKLYVLRATDPASYMAMPDEAPIGQTIVKQTWAPVEVDPEEVEHPGFYAGGEPTTLFTRALREGDRAWRTGEPGPVFFMRKYAPGTAGTDNGWVYGATTPEGELLEAGALASCMLCHNGIETTDRLFGPSGW